MTSFARRLLLRCIPVVVGAAIEACFTTALADTFPSRPIKIIVGQGTGTTSDIIARLVGTKLAELLDQPVVIEGHSGAAGTIAAAMVAKSPADGFTLLLASSSNLAMATVSMEGLQYDPIKDFAPIGRIARIPWALGANPKLPAKTVSELIAYARTNPGRVTGASTGPGSAASFGIETLNRKAGIDILNVPYRTAAAQIQALLAGEVDLLFTDLSLFAPHVKAGTMRLLAAAGTKRLRAFPDLPTMAEQGIAEIALEPWYGLAAPAGTPPEILAKLSDGLASALRAPDVRNRMLDAGYELIEESPADFAAAINADIARFAAAAKSAEKTGRKIE